MPDQPASSAAAGCPRSHAVDLGDHDSTGAPAPAAPPQVPELWNPTPARYQALAQQAAEAMYAFAAGEIDFRTFRHRTEEIRAQTRPLDLLRRLARASQRLAAQEQKSTPSKTKLLNQARL